MAERQQALGDEADGHALGDAQAVPLDGLVLEERAGEADIILAKHRGGPIDTVQVAHQLHYSKFVNMAHG